MPILLRFLLRNIKEKKMRTLLIVVSIAVSTALFFASMAVTDSAMNIYIKQVQSSFGESEIVIQPNDRSPDRYFRAAIPSQWAGRIAYTIGITEADALYRHENDEAVNFVMKGVRWEDVQRMSPIQLKEGGRILPFVGKKAIISDYIARKYKLKPGRTLELDINQKRYRFIIAGIAGPSGLFTGNNNLLLVPRSTLSRICSRRDRVSKLYIKLKNPADRERIMAGLSQIIQRYDVRNSISDREFQERTEPLAVTLTMTLVVVLILSVFIIYSSFKVITSERMPVIGTFRSIGAERGTTDLLLLAESGIYGLLGGVLGCILGLGVLVLMTMAMTESPGGSADVTLSFNLSQLVEAFVMALILSMVSSLLPILKVSRIPVKDIVLNLVQKKETLLKPGRLVVGLAIIAFILVVPAFLEGDLALWTDVVCIGLSIAGSVLLVPFIIAALLRALGGIIHALFGAPGVLALQNLRGNKNMQNSIVLLSIGIATILMVNTFGQSILMGMTDFTRRTLDYDISLMIPEMDRTVEPVARSVPGVQGVLGLYGAEEVEVVGENERIVYLEGVDPTRFSQFKTVLNPVERNRLLQKLNRGRNILLNNLLKVRYDLEKGDAITLRLNSKERTYRIIGFMDTMEGGGSYAVIADRFFRADLGRRYYRELAVKAAREPDTVLKALREKFNRRTPSGTTMDEFRKQLGDEIGGILAILNGFSLLTALIGLVGLINNLIVGFLDRRRSLAVLRSIGAARTQLVRMIVIEAVLGGFIGGLVGLSGGLLMTTVMPSLMKAMLATIPMTYSVQTLTVIGLGGLLVMVLASIAPALRTSRLNIIQAIKYE